MFLVLGNISFLIFLLDAADALAVMMDRLQIDFNGLEKFMIMMKTVFAPAKINLCLHVTGRREDGYHDLATLMQKVDVQDRLDIVISRGVDITVCCPQLVLPDGAENIAARAARLFLSYVEEECSVSIRIDKKTPAAAGLGGGSSDAAAVLLALNSMLNVNLSKSELMSHWCQGRSRCAFFPLWSVCRLGDWRWRTVAAMARIAPGCLCSW